MAKRVNEILGKIRMLSPEERQKLFFQLIEEYPELKNITSEWYPGDDEFEQLLHKLRNQK